MKDNDIKSKIAILRKKAEELIKKKNTQNHNKISEADTLKLIHELEVHQIELEMQNNELRLAKEELETSKKNLEIKNDELERFYKIAIDRELVMIDLKKKIKNLEEKNQTDI